VPESKQLPLAVLASYRVAHMIANEDGPGFVFLRVRAWAMRWPWLEAGISCPLCFSFWVALPMLFAPRRVLEWLGVAGGVLIVHRWLERACD
jgi:hypothetical protein